MFKSLLLRNHKVDEEYTLIHVYDIILYINCVLCFVQVAMATFTFLWLYLANSQVSVYDTIGPLVLGCY